jgi:hypothetical protein
MHINLKEHHQDKETLKYIQSVLRNTSSTVSLANKLEKIIKFYDETETDLELAGESIVELDKPRLKAIEEKNKFINFIKHADDV